MRRESLAELDWYFSEGISSFERSPLGPQLEHAEMFYAEEQAAESQPSPPRPTRSKLRAPLRRGHSGCIQVRRFDYVPPDASQFVPDYIPVAKRDHSQREEPARALLRRHGKISERLKLVAAQGEGYVEVLRLWHGNEGAAWARHERGRAVALLHLTPSGQALIFWEETCAAVEGNSLELNSAERLRNAVQLDIVQAGQSKLRRKLILRGIREAHAMYARAAQAWLESGRAER